MVIENELLIECGYYQKRTKLGCIHDLPHLIGCPFYDIWKTKELWVLNGWYQVIIFHNILISVEEVIGGLFLLEYPAAQLHKCIDLLV